MLGDLEQRREVAPSSGDAATPNASSIGGAPSSASDCADLVGDPARDRAAASARARVDPDAEQDAADPAGLAVARRDARDLGEQEVRGVVALRPRDGGEAVDGDEDDRAEADLRQVRVHGGEPAGGGSRGR